MTLESAVGEGGSEAVRGGEVVGGLFGRALLGRLGSLFSFRGLLRLLGLGGFLGLLGFFTDPEVLLGGGYDGLELSGLVSAALSAQAAHLAGDFLVVVLGHLGGIRELDSLGSLLDLLGLGGFLGLCGSGFSGLGVDFLGFGLCGDGLGG